MLIILLVKWIYWSLKITQNNKIIDPNPPTTATTINDGLVNQTRQLEAIAFPVGIAIGAIGAAIWPSLFPQSTTSTPTSGDDSVSSSDDSASFEDSFSSSSSTTGETTTTTTTTFEPRTLLENFPDCGVKGSSNRVVGGAEVMVELIKSRDVVILVKIVEGEYPWLCSLKYRGSHICGMTLLSGPPHDTILVGAAHCFSVGDDLQRYTVTCGEHSLQRQDSYQVTLQVMEYWKCAVISQSYNPPSGRGSYSSSKICWSFFHWIWHRCLQGDLVISLFHIPVIRSSLFKPQLCFLILFDLIIFLLRIFLSLLSPVEVGTIIFNC